MALRLKCLYLSGTAALALMTFLLYDSTCPAPMFLSARRLAPEPPPEYEEADLSADDHQDMLPASGGSDAVADELWNLPREYFEVRSYLLPRSVNSSCARFPEYTAIEYNNYYWQTARTSNGTFQLFGAYLDDRNKTSVVRLLGVVDRKSPGVTTHCQFWYSGRRSPVVVKSERYRYIWVEDWGTQGANQPYFVDCVLPDRGEIPFGVSLVERPCETATNALRVVYNKAKRKKRFAVCVKGLDYPHDDVSIRLIEWLEVIRALGADRVHFYTFTVHPNISRTLAYYRAQGFAEVTPLTLPGGYPNLPPLRHRVLTKLITQRRQMEVVPYNDCFYRHMYEYDYVVLLDTDEIIVPKRGDWFDLIAELERDPKYKKANAFFTRNVYFLDEFLPRDLTFPGIPDALHIMRHVYRTQNFTPPRHYVKTFHKTSEVVTLHNHLPLECMGRFCRYREIRPEVALLQHYRADCARGLREFCLELKRKTVMDTGVWRFKEGVVEGAMRAMGDLGYLG